MDTTPTTCGARSRDGCMRWICQRTDCDGAHEDRAFGRIVTWRDGEAPVSRRATREVQP